MSTRGDDRIETTADALDLLGKLAVISTPLADVLRNLAEGHDHTVTRVMALLPEESDGARAARFVMRSGS